MSVDGAEPDASPPCTFETRQVGEAILVTAVGEIDIVGAAGLRTVLRAQLDAARPTVILDLSEISFLDSSGLGALISAQRQTRLFQGSLTLLSPSPFVARLLHVTSLDKVFRVINDLGEFNGAELKTRSEE